MRLEQLLHNLRSNRSWEQMSRDTGDRYHVSRARLSALAGGDVLSAIDAKTAIGIGIAGDIPPRTVWLACGESLGLPDMFVGGPEAEARGMLPEGWYDLTQPRARILRTVAATLLSDQAAETRITELEAEITRLRARNRATG